VASWKILEGLDSGACNFRTKVSGHCMLHEYSKHCKEENCPLKEVPE